MKARVLFFALTLCFLTLAAWLLHVPNPARANEKLAHEVPEKYRATVAKGLEYLARSQCADGHWEGEGGKHPVAMTGLAGIALVMEGSTVQTGKYSANIRKAVDWLLDKRQPGGLIFSGHPSETSRYMVGHGLATLFLTGTGRHAYGKMQDAIVRAVKYIRNAQSTQGGWYYTSKIEGHDFDVISATVIQIQALQAAEYLIGANGWSAKDGLEYLNMALAKHEEKGGRGQARDRAVETAAALACRFSPGSGGMKVDDSCEKWLKYCRTEIPMGRAIQFGRDELTHYYYAQAMYVLLVSRDEDDNRSWTDYRTAMFDHLQSSQNKDGSWPAPAGSQNGIGVGPVYAAAVWCTVLQLDRNSHPSALRVEDVK